MRHSARPTTSRELTDSSGARISCADRHDDRSTSIVWSVTDQLASDGLDESAPPQADGTATFAEPGAASTATDQAPVTDVMPEPAPISDRSADATPTKRRRRQRISKWDRPPDPHDWRFFVGNLGKVLIATGLLMFGFVAYQLWGTGIETARAQSALKNEFQELIDQQQAAAPGSNGTDADPSDPGATDASNDEPSGTETQPAGDAIDAPVTGDVDDASEPAAVDAGGTDAPADAPAPAIDGNPSGGDSAVAAAEPLVPIDQDIPPIFRGDPLALLEIPAIGRSDIVVPGVSLNDLKDGPGHYPDTPLPGQLGNASIAGHRTTYGAPFFNVDDLVPGDELIVTMLTGDQFIYEVTGIEVVSASDYWVVTTSDPTKAELTLTSCDPKYTARDRIVVHSVLNPAKSSNVGFPTAPYELEPEENPEPIPGDDPVLVADEPAVDVPTDETPTDDASADSGQADPTGDDTTGDDTTVEDDRPTAAEPDDDTSPAAGTGDDNQTDSVATPADPGADAELDAFSQGWFDDRDAFPQIALWGLVLTLISIAAYRISRRFRHDSIGFLAGIFPFLFCLYFFFQNVNRLLPPGL
jgi:sortase A